MIALCKNNNVPDPIFEEYSGGFSVTFKFRLISVEERRKKILQLLASVESLSAREIHSKINVDVSFRTIKVDLLSLKEQRKVRRVGTGKKISWQFVAK